jgi:hypothetical protein
MSLWEQVRSPSRRSQDWSAALPDVRRRSEPSVSPVAAPPENPQVKAAGQEFVWLTRGGIHHDTVQPGRDRGIAVNAGGAVGLLPEDVCVSNVPSGFFDHVDVDPP